MIEPTETESRETLDAVLRRPDPDRPRGRDRTRRRSTTPRSPRRCAGSTRRWPRASRGCGGRRPADGRRGGDDGVPSPRHGAARRRLQHGAGRGAAPGPARGREPAHAPLLRLGSADRLARATGSASIGGIDLDAARRLGVGVVRRPTGGSAILHEGPDLELTYSVVAGAGDFPGADDLLEHVPLDRRGARAGLRERSARRSRWCRRSRPIPATMPAFCFARTGSYELEVGGRKLVGSAQRRQGTGVPPARLGHARGAPRPARAGVPGGERDPLGGMTTLEAVLGRRPTFAEMAEALADGFREAHGIELAPGGLWSARSRAAERSPRQVRRPRRGRGRAARPASHGGRRRGVERLPDRDRRGLARREYPGRAARRRRRRRPGR